jgi:hypothetical protein
LAYDKTWQNVTGKKIITKSATWQMLQAVLEKKWRPTAVLDTNDLN